MAIPVFKLQACGRFHVPGARQLLTGRDVQRAVCELPPEYRIQVETYIRSGESKVLPPAPALQALKEAMLAIARNEEQATPRRG